MTPKRRRSAGAAAILLAIAAGGCVSGEAYRGQAMTITGRVMDVPQQHLLANPRGRITYYIQVEPGKEFIAYAPTRIECDGPVRLTGRWITQEGSSDTRWAAPLADRQFEVSRWSCER